MQWLLDAKYICQALLFTHSFAAIYFIFAFWPSIKNTQLQRVGSFLAAVAAVSLRPVLSAHLVPSNGVCVRVRVREVSVTVSAASGQRRRDRGAHGKCPEIGLRTALQRSTISESSDTTLFQ